MKLPSFLSRDRQPQPQEIAAPVSTTPRHRVQVLGSEVAAMATSIIEKRLRLEDLAEKEPAVEGPVGSPFIKAQIGKNKLFYGSQGDRSGEISVPGSAGKISVSVQLSDKLQQISLDESIQVTDTDIQVSGKLGPGKTDVKVHVSGQQRGHYSEYTKVLVGGQGTGSTTAIAASGDLRIQESLLREVKSKLGSIDVELTAQIREREQSIASAELPKLEALSAHGKAENEQAARTVEQIVRDRSSIDI